MIDTKSKCESKLNLMCNTRIFDKNKVKKSQPSKKIDVDVIESIREIESNLAANKASKPKKTAAPDIQLTTENNTLKNEITIVRYALDEQKIIINRLESDLKVINELVNKKELKIQSLLQIIEQSNINKLLDLAKYIIHNFGEKNDLTSISVANGETKNRLTLLMSDCPTVFVSDSLIHEVTKIANNKEKPATSELLFRMLIGKIIENDQIWTLLCLMQQEFPHSYVLRFSEEKEKNQK